jgi:acetyl-CoA hydrolase
MTLGPSHGFALAAARRARTVIAEVNERMPWVHGGELPTGLRIDAIARSARPLPTYPTAKIGDAERRVAAQVAALVPDGATIQLGIGTLPDAVLEALAGHRDLGSTGCSRARYRCSSPAPFERASRSTPA